jgi:hypothetical protein
MKKQVILIIALILIVVTTAHAASIKREYTFVGGTAMSAAVVNNADGTQTVTFTNLSPASGGVTLAGDTTGPSGSNQTTGLHSVVNWASATEANGSALAGGAASAPPATPQTYVQIVVNGNTYFIPCYHTGA